MTREERLVNALTDLERACDRVAAGRTKEVYEAMLASGQRDALILLDEARHDARALLALLRAEQEQS